MRAKTYETIICEKSGGVVRLTLNRPEHRNGITGRMMLGLRLRPALCLPFRALQHGVP